MTVETDSHHILGSASNQSSVRSRSASSVGDIAFLATGRLSVSCMTCSVGKDTISSVEVGGGAGSNAGVVAALLDAMMRFAIGSYFSSDSANPKWAGGMVCL